MGDHKENSQAEKFTIEMVKSAGKMRMYNLMTKEADMGIQEIGIAGLKKVATYSQKELVGLTDEEFTEVEAILSGVNHSANSEKKRRETEKANQNKGEEKA